MIKNLIATFRGNRNYLHSATVINHIYSNKINFKEIKFHKFTKNQIEFSKKRKSELFGKIYLNSKKIDNVIYMNETNTSIIAKQEYPEDEIIKATSIRDTRLIFKPKATKFTFFDITIAMIKQLNYIRFPTEKKWIAASYELLNNEIDFFPKYEIIVEIDKLISGKCSDNQIYYNSSKVAKSKFFLV